MKYLSKAIFLLKAMFNNSKVHPSIELRCPKNVKISYPIFLGENCKLLCWDEYSSGSKKQKLQPELILGSNIHATRDFVVQCANKVCIGNNVLIASNVFIIDYNHGLSPESVSYLDNQLDTDTVIIEDGVWIGNNVTILPGVIIGKKSIIAAGSVVTKSIPQYSIAAGNPAKVIKKYNINNRTWEKEENEGRLDEDI
ncbi:acyltransferase [uncultured Ruminococcus sp.]|uniref:acyltransferase n=1 Tax=uncultured Ruminococcus sp. TaxID=165186 RepID=UPI0025D4FF47|nr:acyltransferase [uncultured Ruminococcus sp.]